MDQETLHWSSRLKRNLTEILIVVPCTRPLLTRYVYTRCLFMYSLLCNLTPNKEVIQYECTQCLKITNNI